MARVGTSVVAATSTTGTSSAVAFSVARNCAAGNLLVASILVGDADAHTPTIADSQGNTWTPLTTATQTSVQSLRLAYTVQNVGTLTTSDTISVTPSNFANRYVLIVEEFDNPAGTLAVEESTNVVTSGGGTASTAGSVTVGSGGWLIVSAYTGNETSYTLTSNDGSTQTDHVTTAGGSADRGQAFFYKEESGSGTYTSSATKSATANYAAVMAAFQTVAAATDHTATPSDALGLTDIAAAAKTTVWPVTREIQIG